MYKRGAMLALSAMSVLLIWALVFYKERMVLCDESYIFFRIVNEQKLQIQQFRYGAFITQMFPLIAAKLHIPLKQALMLYSVSFNLFYLAVAFIVFRLREYKLVILMSFYYLLMTSDSFFWTNNEVYQGIAWMFLFYAIILRAGKTNKLFIAILSTIVLGGLAMVSHPLVAIPFIYLWGFYIINGKEWPFNIRISLLLSVLVVLLAIGRAFISAKYAGYDSEIIHNVAVPDADKIKTIMHGQFFRELLRNTKHNYWILPLLFIAGVISMLRNKKFLLTIWTLIFCFGYFAIVCLTFEGYLAFYTESELMPGIILATAAFVFFTVPGIKKELALALLVLIFINRLYIIHRSSYIFKERHHFINSILYKMKQKNISKLALIKPFRNADPRLKLDWGLPAETIIASALAEQQPQRQFLIRTADQLWDFLPRNDNKVLMSCYDNLGYDKLNPLYFRPDTAAYTVMPVDSFIAPYKGD